MPNLADAMKLLATLLAIMSVQASAQDYPARNVRFIVPQVPGGATDVFARAVGQKLSDRWGRTIVVENRGGAGGTLGTDVVAKSAPDGHTMLVTYAGSQAINQSLFPKLSYDSVKDFQTVATLAVTPFLLIVNNSLPAKSLKEFIALARGRPDVMAYASSGNGSVNHLLGEMLKIDANIRMLHIPLQRCRARDHRCDCRPGRCRVHQRAVGDPACRQRSRKSAGGDQCAPRGNCPHGADHCRVGLRRL